MAGNGPPPKDPAKRARKNKGEIPSTVIRFAPGSQPDLPFQDSSKKLWHPRTLEWWAKWRDAPQADLFMDTDWEFLLETALLHTRFWSGELSLAGELRLRVAKFGATMEDRARLRLVFAEAEVAEGRAKRQRSVKKSERVLFALPDPANSSGA